MTESINHIQLWVKAKYDYLVGAAAGTTAGFTIPDLQIVKALIGSFLFCIATGFAGAFGAHIFKKLIEKINKHKNG